MESNVWSCVLCWETWPAPLPADAISLDRARSILRHHGTAIPPRAALPARIQRGRQAITATVARRPASAGIGPPHELIQRDAEDSVAAVR